MRSIVARILLALLCVVELSGATKLVRPRDPIFGLAYDPSRAALEAADDDLLKRCPDLANGRWTRRMWVFARTGDANARYTIVGGYYVRRAAKAGEEAVETDDLGAVIRETAGACRLIGPAREVFDYPIDIGPSTLALLARDAVARQIRAHGDKQKFLAALSRQKADLDQAPALREAVDAAR